MRTHSAVLTGLLAILLLAGCIAFREHRVAALQRERALAADSAGEGLRRDLGRYQRAARQWEGAWTASTAKAAAPTGSPVRAVDPKALAQQISERYARMNAAGKGLLALGFARRQHLGEANAEKLAELAEAHAQALHDIGSAAFELGQGGSVAAALLKRRENESYEGQVAELVPSESMNAFNAATGDWSASRRGELGYYSALMVTSGGTDALTEDQLRMLADASSRTGTFYVGPPYMPNGTFSPTRLYGGDPAADAAAMDHFLDLARTVLSPEQYPIVENEVRMKQLQDSLGTIAFAKWKELQDR